MKKITVGLLVVIGCWCVFAKDAGPTATHPAGGRGRPPLPNGCGGQGTGRPTNRVPKDVSLAGVFPSSVRCVSVVAPSSKAPYMTVVAATNALTKAGYRVKVLPSVWNYSSDAAVRARDVERAWQDPETDLIICSRGGSGGWDTVTNLNFNILKSRDIPFIGFSNISTLMNAFAARGVKRPISGPMLTSFMHYPTTASAKRRLCETIAGAPLAPTQLKVLRAPKVTVEGRPTGGHWPSISRMDPAFLPDGKGRVAFLEINRSYSFDKATNTFAILKGKGYFASVEAIVLCDLGINGPRPNRARLAQYVVDAVTCPVFAGYPYGHVAEQYAIDYDRPLKITPTGLLTWENK